jgi:hypothetical protein
MALGKRTGVQGLALFVKGHIHDDFTPSFLQCEDSANFFAEELGVNVFDLLTKFEQWMCKQNNGMIFYALYTTQADK